MPKRPAPDAKKPAPARSSAPAGPALRPERRFELKLDLLMPLAAAILAAAVFSGTLHGEWVYDDQRLILANPMIQDPHHFWTSLTSDVFAYRSASGEAGSPYWRPVTTLWFIINHRLYGVERTLGWHIGSILLHTAATVLAFGVMRRLGMGALLAGAAAWVFAVHPTRTESVAWISGVPDLLVSVGLLGSLWVVLGIVARRDGGAGDRDEGATWRRVGLWAAALALYAVALGSKEFSVVYPAIVFAAALRWREPENHAGGGVRRPRVDLSSWKSAAAYALPFALMAAAYLVARAPIVAGAADHAQGPGFWGAARSLPLTGAFYLRQIVLPYWIGPTYPLRPVESIGLLNFVAPGLLVAAVGAGIAWIALGPRGGRAALVGAVLLVTTIAPAALAPGMSPELMVQDRYLYLPLLGFLIVLVVGAHALLNRPGPARDAARAGAAGPSRPGPHRAAAIIAVLAAAACIPLAWQTLRYSSAWMSNLSLWEWGVWNDPDSRFTRGQYGAALRLAGRNEEALEQLDRAIELRQTVSNTLGRAELQIRAGQYDEAERTLTALLADMDTREPAIERFYVVEQLAAIARLRDHDTDRALALLRDVRDKLPNFRAMITDRMAMVLMLEDRREEALAELEAVRELVPSDRSQDARWVYYRLGQLYAERGRLEESGANFREFLRQTEGTGDPQMLQARTLAAEALEVIRRGPPPAPAPAPQGG